MKFPKYFHPLTLALPILLTISACGGSESSSNNNGGSVIPAGNTSFAGTWTVNANINISTGSNATTVNQRSTVIVNSNGSSAISTTNANGSLIINFNGSTVGYQTTILVNNGVTGAAACSITLTGNAGIAGAVNNAAASGSFPSRTIICNGASVSYSGNISGSNVSSSTSTTPDSSTNATGVTTPNS